MLPRQGEMAENTPFTRKCTSEPSESIEKGNERPQKMIQLIVHKVLAWSFGIL